jgi:hypothetical protein
MADETGKQIAQNPALSVILPLAVAAIIGAWALFRKAIKSAYDRHRVHKWLFANTRDTPGESHVATGVLAKGARLPEDRVRNACLTSKKVFRSLSVADGSERWSIWRQDEQSIYETQGITMI